MLNDNRNMNNLDSCSIEVVSGIPVIEPLFNGSVCHNIYSTDIKYGNGESIYIYLLLLFMIDFVDVGVLPSIAIPVNSYSNDDEDHQIEYNVIVGNSRGIITSYSSEGNFLWQLRSRVTWPSKVGLVEVFYYNIY